MAAAVLAKFRMQMFADPVSLQKFVTQNDSPVNTITAITFDVASGKYVLFYMIA